jgi:hypothetical protein
MYYDGRDSTVITPGTIGHSTTQFGKWFKAQRDLKNAVCEPEEEDDPFSEDWM